MNQVLQKADYTKKPSRQGSISCREGSYHFITILKRQFPAQK